MLKRRVLFGLLALALVLAQALALMHRVAHAPDAAPGVQQPAGAVLGDEHDHERGEAGWLAALFAHEGGDPGCRVLDSLGHDAMACPPALHASTAVPAFILSLSLGEFLARRAALFEARGPPVLR